MYRSLSVSSFIMCGFNISGFARIRVSMKRSRAQHPYVQPRSRKIRSKIGIGIPRNQNKMYPVAPASLILFVKRISDILLLVIDSDVFVVCRKLAPTDENTQSGWWMVV